MFNVSKLRLVTLNKIDPALLISTWTQRTHWDSVELHSIRKPIINIANITKVNIEKNKHQDGDKIGWKDWN